MKLIGGPANGKEKEAIELLRKHEWSGSEESGYCQECGGNDDGGHEDGCKWAELIKENR